jgi:Putative outer membrane beta-barrel porin, MtrB/PioB
MRNRLMIGTAALLLASAGFAGAQDTPQPETTPTNGTIDIGGRLTTTDGDEARYERYRDLRDGLNANFLYSKETANWTFDVKARNIGYRDGRYELGFSSKRVKFNAMFDQIPLNYSYESLSPYNCTAGACALDASLRTRVENGAVGVPQNAGQLLGGSIYNSIANPFDLQSRRDTIKADLRISATNNLDFIFGVNTYKRSGNMPYGAGFAFNNAVELPLVIDNRETELSAAAEWASHQGMFHVGYEHDKFNQNIPSFTYDNPLRATDFCRFGNAAVPPGTCYDPSGYVNGNGPALGRTASPPSNSVDTMNWMGMVKLPGKTTANASFTMGANHQDAALIPWTTNSSINNAATYAAFPGLAALPRDTAQMRVNYATGTMNVSSRAIKDVTLSARYRFNSRSDFTREFDAIEYVRFDAVPEETGGATEPYNINHGTLDVNAAYTGIAYSTIRAGYTYDQYEHSVRATQGWKDSTARISYDLVGNQYVTLRAQYEHTKRDTINFDVEGIIASGAQPDLRFYDEAARKSDRTTAIVELTPTSTVGLDFNLFHGKDDYAGADASQEFGLLNNKNTGWTAGVSYAPSMKVNLGAEYGRETYSALQESRNSNPAPDPSWTDPSRNWSLANDETVNTFSAYANLVKLVAKTDIRASYDLSDSDQAFVHGGPRIVSLTAANQFIPFPDVTNKWQRATIDVSYSVSNKLGVAASYWFEKFDVQDYATINTAGPQTLPVAALGPQTDTPRIDWLGSITTGYAARPYKGQTVFVRVFYNF